MDTVESAMPVKNTVESMIHKYRSSDTRHIRTLLIFRRRQEAGPRGPTLVEISYALGEISRNLC